MKKNGEKAYRNYSTHKEYVKNVVSKCRHDLILLNSKDFISFKIEKANNPNAKLPAGVVLKFTPAKCKSYSCPVCGKKKVMDLMARLKDVNLNNYRFFTLTLVNKYSQDDTKKNLERVAYCFNRLNTQLKKDKRFKNLQYFRVTEIGKNGNVHVHGLWNKYIDQKELSKMWFKITGDSYRAPVEKIKSKEDAVAYLYKYLSKDLQFYNDEIEHANDLFGTEKINNAKLFYELAKRRYSASRNFFKKAPKKENEFCLRLAWIPVVRLSVYKIIIEKVI